MASTGEPYGLFWNSDNGDRTYDANSFEYWLKKFFTSGVFEGDLQVQESSGMTLVVGSGYANVDGKVKFWNAEFNLTLSPANSTYPRIDTVVITRDNVNRQITCEVVTGAYSGDTPQPTAPVRTAEIYQLVLAQIYVGNGVTEITQANITDTRPDTTLCGYIAGTVTEMDFSQFTAQFESYFAQFKTQHENEWSVWEQTQVAAYAAWFDNVKAEQIADKADWDAWYAALQEELHNLPADSAEYLQIQIDEIRENGTTGSIFHVTTTNTELEGKTLTVSCGTEVRTATFDSNLECTVIGFKSVGAVTFTSTDGIQTATKVLNIDYYSKYEVPIAFWSATVNIQGDDNLKGTTVTVKDSDNTTVATIVLNVITGQGVFSAQKADTYTFNYTFSGTDYSEELVVDEETTYSLELSAGFSWTVWVDTARDLDSSDYASLSEVLADEEAVRELFLEHACVDYMAESESVNEDLATILNTDLAAKWINNSDYALDHFYAVADIKTVMDTADKYGYGEWDLVPQVPKMSSNTAPAVGEASASSGNSNAYKAFDNNDSDAWGADSQTSGDVRLAYKFTSPTEIRKALLYNNAGTGAYNLNVRVDYSDDGTTWSEGPLFVSVWHQNSIVEIPSVGSHLYWSFYFVSTTTGVTSYFAIPRAQFYAWAPKGNVPLMTSNTAPYGAISYSSAYSSSTPQGAFNNLEYTVGWYSNNASVSAGDYLAYKFTNPVRVKKFYIGTVSQAANTIVFKLQASNDGTTWVDISDPISMTLSVGNKRFYNTYNVDSEDYYLHYRVIKVSSTIADYFYIPTLQFYGRELKVSVPKMTSNTAPFGEAGMTAAASSGHEAWYAFDNDDSTYAAGALNTNIGVSYDFTKKVVIKAVKIYSTDSRLGSFKVQGSNDGSNWSDLFSGSITSATETYFHEITNETEYRHYRLYALTAGSGQTGYIRFYSIQFYGVDYSEKEFEAGTTKKWLYDHGVELEELDNAYVSSMTQATITKNNNSITIDSRAASGGRFGAVYSNVDLTPYSMAYAIAEFVKVQGGTNNRDLRIGSVANEIMTTDARYVSPLPQPYKMGVDISAFNEIKAVAIGSYMEETRITELWLE